MPSTTLITPLFAHQAGPYHAYGIRLIVDLENCIKAPQNQYYARKVKIGNLKQMAGTLAFLQDNGIGSVEELSRLLSSTYSDFNKKQKAMRSTESRLHDVNLLIKNPVLPQAVYLLIP